MYPIEKALLSIRISLAGIVAVKAEGAIPGLSCEKPPIRAGGKRGKIACSSYILEESALSSKAESYLLCRSR